MILMTSTYTNHAMKETLKNIYFVYVYNFFKCEKSYLYFTQNADEPFLN